LTTKNLLRVWQRLSATRGIWC